MIGWSALWRVALASAMVGGCVLGEPEPTDPSLPPTAEAPPQLVAAYHLVEDGRQQLALGRTDAALATFQKALALAPSSPHANLALGEAKLRRGEARSALIYCDRVARLTG
ncbi:MAG: tetratricopeptide repeat protein, partial [Nitrospiria bacterium]